MSITAVFCNMESHYTFFKMVKNKVMNEYDFITILILDTIELFKNKGFST